MPKALHISDRSVLVGYQQMIVKNLTECKNVLRGLIEKEDPMSLFAKCKYDKIGIEPLTGEDENIIEVINQAQTYLVSLKAVEYLLDRYPAKEFIVNWGNIAGYDVESVDGTIIAEVFAATSYRSNSKLTKDLKRLSDNKTAKIKFEFFHDKEFTPNHRTYYSEKYPGIEIVKFDSL